MSRKNKVYSNLSTEEDIKLRFISNNNFDNYKFSFGGNFQLSKYSNRTLFKFYNINYNSNIDFFKYGLFIKSSRRFFNDNLSVSFGIRTDQDNFTSENKIFENISPRLALSLSLSKKQ